MVQVCRGAPAVPFPDDPAGRGRRRIGIDTGAVVGKGRRSGLVGQRSQFYSMGLVRAGRGEQRQHRRRDE